MKMLRKTVAVALLLMLCSSVCLAADWVEVAKLKNGDAIAIDRGDIAFGKNVVSFTVRGDVTVPFSNGAKSVVSRMQYNIVEGLIRQTEDVFVFADGRTQRVPGLGWSRVNPDSAIGEEVRQAIRFLLADAQWLGLDDVYAVNLTNAGRDGNLYWFWIKMEKDGKVFYMGNEYDRTANTMTVGTGATVEIGTDGKGVLAMRKNTYLVKEGSNVAEAVKQVIRHFGE